MNFESELTRKILDPVHGIIRLTSVEIEVINHPLFQRLRNIKQNSFLYKIFPSAVHSRFEHSLGVLHLSNEIIDHLRLNAIRYQKKYNTGNVFGYLNEIQPQNLQELRLAALLHDVGHGPMSHQFDSFMPDKEQLSDILEGEFTDVLDLIKPGKKVEHEHISLIFTLIIYNDLKKSGKIADDINISNVLKIIEKDYGDKQVVVKINDKSVDILPLLTSIISSCPIDADRMDYLLRDSYFSGVKCGIYDYNRLFMSIVPVEENGKIYLAYKESGIDSIVEFISARSSLFAQVYFHKTNRAFSAMLDKICEGMKGKSHSSLIIEEIRGQSEKATDGLQELYRNCSDDYFLNEKLGEWIEDSDTDNFNQTILDNIVDRLPWSKIYEKKHHENEVTINSESNKDFIASLKGDLNELLERYFNRHEYAVDIVSDTAFKDIDKTEVKLLIKNLNNTYEIRSLGQCGSKLDPFQSIKYFIRIFIDRKVKDNILKTPELIKEIDDIVVAATQKAFIKS